MSKGSNQFGDLFTWSTFGESHGEAMGVVMSGIPAGVPYNEKLLLENLSARRPGQPGTTGRDESDTPEILSGLFENKTLGTPLAVIVKNSNQKSSDYEGIKDSPRVGHADDLWSGKYGVWDYRGGGRASARETLNWVIAGSFAQMLVNEVNSETSVTSQLVEVGGEVISSAESLEKKLEAAKSQGESFGALIEVVVKNPSPFLGEPVFKKTKSELAKAYMMINACVGVEFGGGFDLAAKKGTEVHLNSDSPIYGGLRGGLTTGEDICFRLAFKPTSSILDTAKKGRHDPCVAVRAVPVVKAVTWTVLADLELKKKLNRL